MRKEHGNVAKMSCDALLLCTADCNKRAEQWKTTIDVLCLNQEEGHAEAVKIMRFIHGKSIVVFHCPLGMLQDFCNLL